MRGCSRLALIWFVLGFWGLGIRLLAVGRGFWVILYLYSLKFMHFEKGSVGV